MLENCQKNIRIPAADGNCCAELLVSREYNQSLLRGPTQDGLPGGGSLERTVNRGHSERTSTCVSSPSSWSYSEAWLSPAVVTLLPSNPMTAQPAVLPLPAVLLPIVAAAQLLLPLPRRPVETTAPSRAAPTSSRCTALIDNFKLGVGSSTRHPVFFHPVFSS